MEMTSHTHPLSWEDKGLDWENPDPRNADYMLAIRAALLERYAAVHRGIPSLLMAMSPGKCISRAYADTVLYAIENLCGSFVNLECEEYAEDFSDFPRRFAYRDLVGEESCRLYALPAYGSVAAESGAWLRAAKEAIDRLTVIPAGVVKGVLINRSGEAHDPPFAEAVSTSIARAMERTYETPVSIGFPVLAYGWSGNTHYSCPNGDPETPELNRDGYCGYALSWAYRITAARSWLRDAEFDIFASLIPAVPEGPVNNSSELQSSVFDTGSSGLKPGINWTERVHVTDPHSFDFHLGYEDAIPANGAVPASDFDAEGNALVRRSTKRGWTARTAGFIDYGCENGFKFRKGE